ncbi:MAG: RluA family pseudouridine synthase [Christensenella sp.]|uniref:RluA family pseudouridine synthase n=1 Tax=Christensenella sp. TaxID=1935934 RepID=UPI002B21A5DC|nr:RluA family pseudouridine synthase [Christensenella sp.]MEA5004573.1 RluA family pseudouridine synthase [Christensenella sp.]
MTESHKIIADESGARLDSFLAGELTQYTRSYLKQLIDNGGVFLNGRLAKASTKIRSGDEVTLTVPRQQEVDILPEDIPLTIVYQDKDIAVINKAQGMVTHPAVGNYTGTLVNALLHHLQDLSGINGELRPGIVHRLDKGTSGLLVVAKNDEAHQSLSKQIEEKTASRVYQALVFGNIKTDEGVIMTHIGRDPRDRKKMAVLRTGGREAITQYSVLARYEGHTLVECTLKTGRTHQIRVHLKHFGFPVVGDPVYTKKKDKFGLNGQLLHAYKLGFHHPRTGEWMEFLAPLPDYFENVLQSLKKI